MIDCGSGEPVVIVPGIQGRWEWMEPAVRALAAHHRVIAYSLCDEWTSGFGWDPAVGFENYVRQLGEVLDHAGLDRATLVGVSYGGLIAIEFAARHPERVNRLVLASALTSEWHPNRQVRFYMRAPRLLSPLFVASAPLRLGPEVRAAFPNLAGRARFVLAQTWRVMRSPMSPAKMARRVRWAEAHHFADLTDVQAPVLVVTGEAGLDKVVPVEVSQRAAARARYARHVVLPHTGHLGIVTKPDGFCRVMDEFVTNGI